MIIIRIAESLFPGRLVERQDCKARQVFNMSHSRKTLRWPYQPDGTGPATVGGKPGATAYKLASGLVHTGSPSVVNNHDLKLSVWYDKQLGDARRQLDSVPMLAS
jgi:hypothetical protein